MLLNLIYFVTTKIDLFYGEEEDGKVVVKSVLVLVFAPPTPKTLSLTLSLPQSITGAAFSLSQLPKLVPREASTVLSPTPPPADGVQASAASFFFMCRFFLFFLFTFSIFFHNLLLRKTLGICMNHNLFFAFHSRD